MKPMFKRFQQRAVEHEMMDDFSTGGLELREALQHLRRLNRIFGAASSTLYGVQRLWVEAGKPSRFSMLDIGAGSGDVNRRILRWADRKQIDLTITLADITEEACEEARQLFHNEPRIQVRRCDLFDLPDNSVDAITATQFIHHFAADELPRVMNQMLKASRLGIVVNDIHRHWVPWAAVWLTARVISKNRYIVHDGPLSVAKGFRSEDWDKLRQALNVSHKSHMVSAWRPLFRYVVVIWKSKS